MDSNYPSSSQKRRSKKINNDSEKKDIDEENKKKLIQIKLIKIENDLLMNKIIQKDNIIKGYKQTCREQKRKIIELRKKINEIVQKEKKENKENKENKELKKNENSINNSFEDQIAIKAIEEQIANEIRKNIPKNKYKEEYNNNNSKLDKIETIEFNIDNALFFQCGVCMDTFQDRENLKRLSCGHIYHKECLNQWIQNNNYCQLCAKVIFH